MSLIRIQSIILYFILFCKSLEECSGKKPADVYISRIPYYLPAVYSILIGPINKAAAHQTS